MTQRGVHPRNGVGWGVKTGSSQVIAWRGGPTAEVALYSASRRCPNTAQVDQCAHGSTSNVFFVHKKKKSVGTSNILNTTSVNHSCAMGISAPCVLHSKNTEEARNKCHTFSVHSHSARCFFLCWLSLQKIVGRNVKCTDTLPMY